MMKRILLTGASGTVGREVLKQLCTSEDAFEIVVFDKKSKSSNAFYKEFDSGIHLIYGDISNKNEICKACKNVDAVVHLAAIIPPLADRYPELAEDVNITGTKNLIESIEMHSPDAFFIYSSSISVYGDRKDNPLIKVSDKMVPSHRDEYARTKIEAERLITGSRLKWTIFRLTAIMGINNHKPSAIMFHMPLETSMEIATPADTGRAFVNALRFQEKLNQKIFNLGGGEQCRISHEDFLSRSFEIFGLGKINFPKGAFANKNFHCGYYADGDELNRILNFRQDTIDDYFESLRRSVSPVRKLLTTLLRDIIKRRLCSRSEPLAAIRANNKVDLKHYF